MKSFLSILVKNLRELIDPRQFILAPIALLRYLMDLIKFRRQYKGEYPVKVLPVLFDRTGKNSFDAHYVYQAHWATHRIIRNGLPERHIDVSSNVSFIVQLSALLPVIQLEYQPSSVDLAAYHRIAGNILELPFQDGSVSSASCLHVVEHIGLSRYGDPMDGAGSRKCLKELDRILSTGGNLFLSVPVGKACVYFNAHIVFNPEDIRQILSSLSLVEFSFINDEKELIENGDMKDAMLLNYGLGLYHFKKDGQSKSC